MSFRLQGYSLRICLCTRVSSLFSPSQRELRLLDAYVMAGTCRKAGEDLGMAEQSVKNALYLLRLKARVSTNQQLVYEFADQLRGFRRVGA